MPERQVITSLTGTIAPLLTVNTADARAIDYCSKYLPREWSKTTPFVTDEVQVQPNNQSLLNTEMAFEIAKQAHLLRDICVRFTMPPHIVAPAFNPAFYVDHLGFALIDYLRLHFHSNLTYQREAYDLYFKYRKAYTDEERDAVNYLVRGDQTIAQRTLDLANGVDMFVDPMLPNNTAFHQSLPLVVLSQKVRAVLKTRSLLNLINTPIAGTTVTPNGLYNMELWLKHVHLTGNEGDMLVDMSRQNAGICYMIHQNVRQNADDVFSTQNGFIANIKLSGMTKPLRLLRWAFVPTKLQNDTGRNDMFFFQPQPVLGPIPPGMNAYNPIVSWNIQANGQTVQRSVLRDYNRVYDHYHNNPSRFGDEIFEQLYTLYPHSVNAAVGYLDYTNLNNPVLQVIFGTGGTGIDPDIPANPQQLRLIVNAEDYNFWYFKSGNWSRSFN